MKRFLVTLLFLIIPIFTPVSILAAPCASTVGQSCSTGASCVNSNLNGSGTCDTGQVCCVSCGQNSLYNNTNIAGCACSAGSSNTGGTSRSHGASWCIGNQGYTCSTSRVFTTTAITCTTTSDPNIINPPIIIPKTYTTCEFRKTDPNQNIFSKIWAWITSLFSKPYDIDINRNLETKKQDMSDYGNVSVGASYELKHSYSGSKATAINTQDCLKGEIIRKVLLNNANNTTLGYINDSPKTISDLAKYLLQNNQKFLCSPNDVKIDTPANIISEINRLSPATIPKYEEPCYDAVYDDFFLTPLTVTNDQENTKKIMNQPIPNQDQIKANTVEDKKILIDNLFSPQAEIDKNKASGLEGLRPAAWPK